MCIYNRYYKWPVYLEETIEEGQPLVFPAVTLCALNPLNRKNVVKYLSNWTNCTICTNGTDCTSCTNFTPFVNCTNCTTVANRTTSTNCTICTNSTKGAAGANSQICTNFTFEGEADPRNNHGHLVTDLLPKLQHDISDHFYDKSVIPLMLELDKPHTYHSSNDRLSDMSESLNLLNDVLMFSYTKKRHENGESYRLPFRIKHTEKPQCKEFSFEGEVKAERLGKDYSMINIDDPTESDWDDSIFFAIPSGPKACESCKSECDEFKYSYTIHPPNVSSHNPTHFYKYRKTFAWVGIDSFTERTALGRPYSNCTDVWPEAIKAQNPEHPTLKNKYSLNECIANFGSDNDHCTVECKKQEYSVGRNWQMKFDAETMRKFFNLTQNGTDYTFLEFVFMRLKKRVINQRAVYTTQQILGTVGGLLGLYMGISVVSLFEIVEVLFTILVKMIKKSCFPKKA